MTSSQFENLSLGTLIRFENPSITFRLRRDVEIVMVVTPRIPEIALCWTGIPFYFYSMCVDSFTIAHDLLIWSQQGNRGSKTERKQGREWTERECEQDSGRDEWEQCLGFPFRLRVRCCCSCRICSAPVGSASDRD